MKHPAFDPLLSLINMVILQLAALSLPAYPSEIPDLNDTFIRSYEQVSVDMVAAWDSVFSRRQVRDDPFGMLIELVRHFSGYGRGPLKEPYTIDDIVREKKSNAHSGSIAVSALMQRMGWDVQVFYNQNECYLGVNLDDDWRIRKGTWIDKDGRKYYLKEFDDETPVGELRQDKRNTTYASLRSRGANLRPFPVCGRLPRFEESTGLERRLEWRYEGVGYAITARIPKALLDWTRNLPPSLYGAAACGAAELDAMSIVDTLKAMTGTFGEFDQVNFLNKLCQSDMIFEYKSGLPIRSVSWQFKERRNDCDGRSVLLFSLLNAVLGYGRSDMVFVAWENHLALAVKPRTDEARKVLKLDGSSVNQGFFILDAAYAGDTQWGDRMKNLPERYEIID